MDRPRQLDVYDHIYCFSSDTVSVPVCNIDGQILWPVSLLFATSGSNRRRCSSSTAWTQSRPSLLTGSSWGRRTTCFADMWVRLKRGSGVDLYRCAVSLKLSLSFVWRAGLLRQRSAERRRECSGSGFPFSGPVRRGAAERSLFLRRSSRMSARRPERRMSRQFHSKSKKEICFGLEYKTTCKTQQIVSTKFCLETKILCFPFCLIESSCCTDSPSDVGLDFWPDQSHTCIFDYLSNQLFWRWLR